MDKMQAYQAFWASFTLPAYDENSVPEAAQMPYVTYEAAVSSFDEDTALAASLWYRSTSWAAITAKADEIAAHIGRGGKLIPFDGGVIWLRRGVPFYYRSGDDDDENVRRIVLNVSIEFLDTEE